MGLAVEPARAQTIPAQDLPAIQKKQDSIQRRHDDDVRQREVERREFIDRLPDGMQTPRIEAFVVSFDVAWSEALRRHHSLTRRGHQLYTSLSLAY